MGMGQFVGLWIRGIVDHGLFSEAAGDNRADSLIADPLIGQSVANPGRVDLLEIDRFMHRVQCVGSQRSQVAGRNVVAIEVERNLLLDVEMEAIAGFDDGNAHFIECSGFSVGRPDDQNRGLSGRRLEISIGTGDFRLQGGLEGGDRLAGAQ